MKGEDKHKARGICRYDKLPGRGDFYAIFFLALIVFAAFGNSLQNDFVWDDRVYLLESEPIHNWKIFAACFTDLSRGIAQGESLDLSRPLMALSLFIDYSLFGENPFGYHLNNLFLHLFNTLLVFFLAKAIAPEKGVPLLSATIFAIHPVHTEAIDPVTFREDLLAALFYLLAFLFYLRGEAGRGRTRALFFGGSLIAYIAALLSKEMAITLPAAILLYRWIFSSKDVKDLLSDRLFAGFITLLGVVTVIYLIFIYQLYSGLPKEFYSAFDVRPPATGIATFPAIFLYYVKLLLLPVSLLAYYDFPVIHQLSSPFFLVFALSMGLMIYLLYRRGKRSGFLILWFLLSLLPVSNIVPTFHMIAERFLYLPSVSFMLLISLYIVSWVETLGSKMRIAAGVLSCLAVIFLLSLTVERNTRWKNDGTLWEDVIGKNKRSFVAYTNLGNWQRKAGEPDKAISSYQKAISLGGKNAKVRYNLGLIYYDRLELEAALQEFIAARDLDPKSAVYPVNIGSLYGMMGEHERASAAFREALQIDPDNEFARLNLLKTEEALRQLPPES